MNCTYCGHELPAGSNPRRAFCHEAHKQAYWREQHQADQSAALLAEVEQLCATVKEQAQELEEQAGEIARLQALLDVEKRSLADTMQHPFKAWLRKQPASPLKEKLLANHLFPSRGPRSLYEAYVQRLCTDEEHQDFVRLWKLMLLQS